jgi:hypothetical protein
MAEHIGNLLEGGTTSDHLSGRGVPQHMGTRAMHADACAFEKATRQRAYRLPMERFEGRPLRDEELPLRTLGAPSAYVSDERATNFLQQWKAALAL